MCESQCSMKAGRSDHSCPMTSERQKTSKGNGNSRKVDFFWFFFQYSNFIRSKCESLLGTFIASTLRRPFRTKSAPMNDRFHWLTSWKTKPPSHQVKAASCWLQFWFEGGQFHGNLGLSSLQWHPGSMAIPMTFSADPLKD